MRRSQILAVGGLIGVASLWLVPFEALLPGVNFTSGLRLISLIQPAVLTLLAVFIGQTLAPKVGLGSPVIDAVLAGSDIAPALRPILPFAALAGVISAFILIAHGAYVVPEIARASSLGARLSSFEVPLLSKLLYGGITEELITRWGLLSAFAWLGWRVSGRPELPTSGIFWMAITGSALLLRSVICHC